ncbi:MAG TPA: hypothetical protein ENI77_04350 [Nitrospirae bacterium]|nr:hypothetical protein [Nitrospirota bacterium]
MPKIFEIFGFPLNDKSTEAEECKRSAQCPFMDCECDGGGNRYLSNIDLSNKARLRKYFRDKKTVHSGICSISLNDHDSPWIVCPRRLMVLGRLNTGNRKYQKYAENLLFKHSHLTKGTRLGVWSELKLKYVEQIGGLKKKFDYTFDYLVMPLKRCSEFEFSEITGMSWNKAKPLLESSGFSFARREGIAYVEDFPSGAPIVVEIMTSSTSGGNKKKRTTIPMAFEDAILDKHHGAPGINYRQVWARMVSQLIVKSEVAVSWGGMAFWILQDVLVDYISSSTALDIRRFLAKCPSEINMLSFSYKNKYKNPKGVIELKNGELFAGAFSSPKTKASKSSFQDIIRAPMHPSKSRLINQLIKRRPTNIIVAP